MNVKLLLICSDREMDFSYCYHVKKFRLNLIFQDVVVVTNGAAPDNVDKVKVTVMNIVTAYLD